MLKTTGLIESRYLYRNDEDEGILYDYCENCEQAIDQEDLGDGEFGCPHCRTTNQIMIYSVTPLLEATILESAPTHLHPMYAWLHSQLEDWWMTFDNEDDNTSLDEIMPKLAENKALSPNEWEEVVFHMWQARHDKDE